MATLRKKRKLAAVSRETPEGNRGSRRRNVLDPELTQDYISQVSEEIEGRVTKKLSKEFNKTESRILGALSKLDEFLLNPQVRTCSVVQGASRSANSENREIHGDRSSNDPYPEGGYFSHHSGQLNSPEADMVTQNYSHRNFLTTSSSTVCLFFWRKLFDYEQFNSLSIFGGNFLRPSRLSSIFNCPCFTVSLPLTARNVSAKIDGFLRMVHSGLRHSENNESVFS